MVPQNSPNQKNPFEVSICKEQFDKQEDALRNQAAWTAVQKLNSQEFRKKWWTFLLRCVAETPVEIPEGSDLKEIPISLNCNWIYKSSPLLSNHNKARIYRACAEIVAIHSLVNMMKKHYIKEQKDEFVFCDVFGSNRISSYLDRLISKTNRFVNKKVKGKTVKLIPNPILINYRPILTPSDAIHFDECIRFPKRAFCLVQDIYNESSKHIFERLVGNKFRGAVFMRQFHLPDIVAGVAFEESVFYQEKDKIFQRASKDDPAWYPHEFDNLLLQTNAMIVDQQPLVWAELRRVLDFYVILVKPVNSIPTVTTLPNLNLTRSCDLIVKKQITMQSFLGRLKAAFYNYIYGTETTLYVSVECLNKLRDEPVGKARELYQNAQTMSEIKRILSGAKYELLFSGIPDSIVSKDRVIQDTSTYIIWSNLESETRNIEKNSGIFGHTLATYNKVRRTFSNGKDVLTTCVEFFMDNSIYMYFMRNIIMFAIGLYYFNIGVKMRKRGIEFLHESFNTLSNMSSNTFLSMLPYTRFEHVNHLMIAPVLEEAIKETTSMYGVPDLLTSGVIGALESYQYGETRFLNMYFPYFTWRGVEHYLIRKTSGGNLGIAILSHFLRNLTGKWWITFLAPILEKCFILYMKNKESPPPIDSFDPPEPPSDDDSDFKPPPSLPTGLVLRTLDRCFDEVHWRSKINTGENSPDQYELGTYQISLDMIPPSMYPLNPHPEVLKIPQNLYEGKSKSGYYPLAIAIRPMIRPQGIYHFMHAYHSRNMGVMDFEELCKCVGMWSAEHSHCKLAKHWRKSTDFMLRLLGERRHLWSDPEDGKEYLSVEEWIDNYSSASKRLRAKRAYESIEDGTINVTSDIFLKSDEVLFNKPDMKGRTVKAVHTTVQVLAAEEKDLAMRRLKMAFSEHFKVKDYSVSFAVGSGRTPEEISVWFNTEMKRMESDNSMAFIFAGDDTFFIVNLKGKLFYGEIDFSKYDRTQGKHALSAAIRIEHALGMAVETCDAMYCSYISSSKYEEKSLNYKARISMPVQRATGGPDTTIGNTINNMLSIIHSLHRVETLEDIPRMQKEMGFQSKFFMDNELMGKTFLKGGFFLKKDQENFTWLPLPSQILKIGKIMTDPKLIFKHVGEKQARVLAAVGMAKGLGTVPINYPILGPFINMYLKIGFLTFGDTDHLFTSENLRFFKDEHKMQLTENNQIDIDYAYGFMLARYGLERQEIEEFHELLHGIRDLPVVINHPINQALEIDYA